MKKIFALLLLAFVASNAQVGSYVGGWNHPAAPAGALIVQSDAFIVGTNGLATNLRLFNVQNWPAATGYPAFTMPAGKTVLSGWIYTSSANYNALLAVLMTAYSQGKVSAALVPKANCTEDATVILSCYEILSVDLAP